MWNGNRVQFSGCDAAVNKDDQGVYYAGRQCANGSRKYIQNENERVSENPGGINGFCVWVLTKPMFNLQSHTPFLRWILRSRGWACNESIQQTSVIEYEFVLKSGPCATGSSTTDSLR